MAAHELQQPKQAKQMKERRILQFEVAAKSCESPHFLPTRCQVPSVKNEVPKLSARECVRTPFYRERDITPMVLRWNVLDSMVGKPLIGRDNPSNESHEFVPNHSLHLVNDTHLEPYSSVDHIPSTTGGNVGA